MKSKKSQAEIVGLVIIVLLITMGLLFVVKFVVLKEQSDIKKGFVHSGLASNMVNVLLKTTTDCRGSSVTELFQDCAGFEKIDCNDDSVPDSCEKIEETIEMIFKNSLEKWNKPYELKAFVGSRTIAERSYGKCSRQSDRESKTYPIPTDRGTLFIKLDICG